MNTYSAYNSSSSSSAGLKQSPSLQNQDQFHEYKNHQQNQHHHRKMNNSMSNYDTHSLYTTCRDSNMTSLMNSDSSYTINGSEADNQSINSQGQANNFLILDQLNQKQKMKEKLKQEKLGRQIIMNINNPYLESNQFKGLYLIVIQHRQN